MKEHQDACKRGDEKVSAIAEIFGSNVTPLAKWEEVTVVDIASKNRELKIKEAYTCRWTRQQHLDIGLELPGC